MWDLQLGFARPYYEIYNVLCSIKVYDAESKDNQSETFFIFF